MNNKEHSFGFHHSMIFRLARINADIINKDLGLSSSQIPFMAFVFERPGSTQDELSTMYVIDKGATARQLAKMEKEGLIYREVDENNRRCKLIYPTPKALQIKADFYAMLSEVNDLSLTGFTDEERSLMLKFMARVLNNHLQFYKERTDER